MTPAEMYARAREVDRLADEVEECVDPAWAVTRTSAWECAHATEVRAALDRWRGAARSSARGLREEASRLRAQARRAEERETAAAASGASQPW